jgi:hypothetical protein
VVEASAGPFDGNCEYAERGRRLFFIDRQDWPTLDLA